MAFRFVKLFIDWVQKQPEKSAVTCGKDDTLSYRELDTLSGRVYSFLKKNGIGREDLVMIILPRSTKAFAAAMGTMKAGGAYTIAEDTTLPERINFILKDSSPKLVIDEQVWQEIENTPALLGYEEVDEHDLAYIAYTSGTTGHSKGTLHEYGAVDQAWTYGAKEFGTCPYGMVTPLNFISFQIILSMIIARGGTIACIPPELVRDRGALMSYIKENGITSGYFTPSVVKMISPLNDDWKFLVVSAEPVCNIYMDHIQVINTYCSSESGFHICLYYIDKPYAITPIGSGELPRRILILDEEGNILPPGQKGEVCYDNPYFRGYQNLPERTRETLRGGIYHSGDRGLFTDDGKLILFGRVDHIYKKNGYVVDPIDIEKQFCEITGLKRVIVRGVRNGEELVVKAFYFDRIETDINTVKARMSEALPPHMLPDLYVYVATPPLLPSGKVDVRTLLEQDSVK